MAKLTAVDPIKPVITKAKEKRKAKINKSKPNEAKAEGLKQAVVALNKDKDKKVVPIIKVNNKKEKVTSVVIEEKKEELKNTTPGAKSKKNKTKNAVPAVKIQVKEEKKKNGDMALSDKQKKIIQNLPSEELTEKYPILKNKELVTKILEVTMTNNQKGRIRQQFRENLKGTSDSILPNVIHNKIKSIVKETESPSDAELRKLRILYNMLKLAVTKESNGLSKVTKNKKKNNKVKINSENGSEEAKENGIEVGAKKENEKKKAKKEVKNEEVVESKSEKKENEKKVKGPKRYVVFVGNLPLDVDREKIMQHFSDLKDHIVDVRIPKAMEEKKSAIAYVELKNEPSYELALSKHHSMLNNRRINVLYSTQQNTKLSKTEAKGKAAKMVALQKSGKLCRQRAAQQEEESETSESKEGTSES